MPAHHADLNELLLSFLGGNRAARTAFPMAVMPYLAGAARRLTPDNEQVLEIVDEVFLALAKYRRVAFDPLRGAAKSFLQGLLKNAARKVRASYRTPGQVLPGSRDDDASASYVDVLASVEARRVLARIEPTLAIAYVRVHVVGETMVEVARGNGVSRFKLARAFASIESAERAAV